MLGGRRPSLIDLSVPLPPVLAPKSAPWNLAGGPSPQSFRVRSEPLKTEKGKGAETQKPAEKSTLEPPEKCNSPRASRRCPWHG